MLRWIFSDKLTDVADHGTFLPGKRVHLEAYRSDPTPDSLQVFQVYSSAMRQILQHVGVPERRPGTSFAAVQLDADTFRSDKAWRLPEPRGWRKSAGFVFVTNNSAENSEPVYTSRVGTARLKTRATGSAKIPGGVTDIGVEGQAIVGVDFLFATDPELRVEVLTGEALAEHMIRNLVTDVASEDDPENRDITARVALELDSLRSSLPYAYVPPDDWSITATQQSIQGDAGDLVTIALNIETPTPGSGYLAVSFRDPDDASRTETCDAWGINVNADLAISAITDPSGLPLQLPVFAY